MERVTHHPGQWFRGEPTRSAPGSAQRAAGAGAGSLSMRTAVTLYSGVLV